MERKRKKWTPIEEITPELVKFRKKHKWQLALRRYVLEKIPSQEYATYFGLSIELFREWIEAQFIDDLSWENFGKSWQFDHIVPVVYFDFEVEEELSLCWNFINIRVERVDLNKARGNRVDVFGVKAYFQDLFERTKNLKAQLMINKINQLEISGITLNSKQENFIKENESTIEILTNLSAVDLSRINKGESIKNILLEQEILKKLGLA